MGAPTVYRCDDDQAPVARGESESLVDILKACLIDGYGSKTPPGGWTMPFVNAEGTKAVFRNDTVNGTGMYLRVSGTNNVNALDGYESMSDIDTGLNRVGNGFTYIHTSQNTGTTPRPWILIADSRSFWLFVYKNETLPAQPDDYYGHHMFFGDIISIADTDPYGCALAAGTDGFYAGYSLKVNDTDATNGSDIYLFRNLQGNVNSFETMNVTGGGPGATNGDGMGTVGSAYVPGGQLFIARPHLRDDTAYSIRGWLPGLYYPCHPLPFDNYTETTADGKTFLNVRTMSYSSVCQVMIDIGDTYRP